MRPVGLPEVPEQTVMVARAAFPKGSLAIRVRDRLAESSLMSRPRRTLTDRQAAAMAVRAIDWKYALGVELTDIGFDASVLCRFRARLVENGMERVVFDRLLRYCKDADDGVPPGQLRLASPYEADARWAAEGGDLFWCG
ncbi:transposase [Streptomyces ipomoeae]|uniref:transposase n=1 Tax=Streptomyces ipomoeae TaxID=103232 RepID=UPI001FD28D37|nr:transposase [Streptomyces ipomoeae]MDX2937664.1 transposase [Streptomyces ipomoeae]